LFNLKPDFSDEQTRDLAARHTNFKTTKSPHLPIAYDTEAIVDQAPPKDVDRTLALSTNVTQMVVEDRVSAVNAITKKDPT
jgi:hypothetical protein